MGCTADSGLVIRPRMTDEFRVDCMSPIVRICHAMRHKDHALATAALEEHDRARIEIAELKRKLAEAKRAILYPMTDLA